MAQEQNLRTKPNLSEIDLENELGKLGIDKNDFEQRHQADRIGRAFGAKSDILITNQIKDGKKISNQARISIKTDKNDKPTINVSFYRKEIPFDKEFLGYKFTVEDKNNILNQGTIGKVVELTYPPFHEQAGQKFNAYIGIDPLMNEFSMIKEESIKEKIDDAIKNIEKIYNCEISAEDKESLLQGKVIKLKDAKVEVSRSYNDKETNQIIEEKVIKPYPDAVAVINAEMKGIEILSVTKMDLNSRKQKELRIPNKIMGVNLSEKQMMALHMGNKLEISGLKSNYPDKETNEFKTFNGIVKFDFEKGRIEVKSSYQKQDKKQDNSKKEIASQKQDTEVKKEQKKSKTKKQTV